MIWPFARVVRTPAVWTETETGPRPLLWHLAWIGPHRARGLISDEDLRVAEDAPDPAYTLIPLDRVVSQQWVVCIRSDAGVGWIALWRACYWLRRRWGGFDRLAAHLLDTPHLCGKHTS